MSISFTETQYIREGVGVRQNRTALYPIYYVDEVFRQLWGHLQVKKYVYKKIMQSVIII